MNPLPSSEKDPRDATLEPLRLMLVKSILGMLPKVSSSLTKAA